MNGRYRHISSPRYFVGDGGGGGSMLLPSEQLARNPMADGDLPELPAAKGGVAV